MRDVTAMKDAARTAAGETDPALQEAMMELVRQGFEKKEREMLEGADGIPSASVD